MRSEHKCFGAWLTLFVLAVAGCGGAIPTMPSASEKRTFTSVRVRVKRGPPRPPAYSEPFSGVVCRIEGESAEILVQTLDDGKSGPVSARVESSSEPVSGGKVLMVSHSQAADYDPAKPPSPFARFRFNVPEEGSYYLFLKGASGCCGCQALTFRLDNGSAQTAGEWQEAWEWQSLRVRHVNGKNARSIAVISEAFDLSAGEHSLGLVWAEPLCSGFAIDELVVAREFRHNIFPDHKGQTLLHRAAVHGSVELVRLCLAHGAAVNVWDENGATPVALAERNGHDEIVRILMDDGAISPKQEEALISAIREGSLAKIKAIAEANPCAIDVPEIGGMLLLHMAAECGQTEIVSFLIDGGLPVDDRDKERITPLHLAAESGSVATVNLLLARGSDVRAKDSSNDTALHASARGGHKELVSLFLRAGLDVNLRGSCRLTPLHWAVVSGRLEVAELLLVKGAGIHLADGYDRTPLYWAAREGDLTMMKFLFGQGAEVNSKTSSHWTPLHVAMRNGTEDVAAFLIENGADVNAADKSGRTPLHWAAWWGSHRIAKLLLAKGASVNAVNDDGRTPHDQAMDRRVKKLLRPAP